MFKRFEWTSHSEIVHEYHGDGFWCILYCCGNLVYATVFKDTEIKGYFQVNESINDLKVDIESFNPKNPDMKKWTII
jgi:hypothetical protein